MEEQIAFSHYSVLLNECIEALAIRPDGIYIDGIGIMPFSDMVSSCNEIADNVQQLINEVKSL